MIRYCIKRFREKDGITYYTDVFPSIMQVRMCILGPEPIYKIDIREATESEKSKTPYFGWLDNEGKINFVFPSFILLNVCFPYGVLAEEKAGTGKMIKVIITEINQV